MICGKIKFNVFDYIFVAANLLLIVPVLLIIGQSIASKKVAINYISIIITSLGLLVIGITQIIICLYSNGGLTLFSGLLWLGLAVLKFVLECNETPKTKTANEKECIIQLKPIYVPA